MAKKIINSFLSWIFKRRIHQIENFKTYPLEVQNEILFDLIEQSKRTEFGKKYNFKEIDSYHKFKTLVPVNTYEDLVEDIERIRKGEENVLCSSNIKWFAKSSGTTNAKSKFIPVSSEALDNTHYKAGKDLLSIYFNNHPDSQIFAGKTLRLGGSYQSFGQNQTYYGDLSSIIIKNMPIWAELVSTPSSKVTLMQEWEAKLKLMIEQVVEEDVRTIAGVPSWMLVLLQRILEKTGSKTIAEVWPNLELFIHGGISFVPYRKQYEEIIGKPINYMEVYNASEGFFAVQDQMGSDEMLLMLDYGIFYEFISMDDFRDGNMNAISIGEVELNKDYALVITTNSGLWRYLIGDTVRFTSLSPYRIKITGRTKHYINAFGEELIIDNALKGLKKATQKTNSEVLHFTVAPEFIDLSEDKKGRHQWLIEFKNPPKNIKEFTKILDLELQNINSDYEAKRYNDMTIGELEIITAKDGLFYNWMKKRGKLGGQNKIPSLSNERKYIDELLKINSL